MVDQVDKPARSENTGAKLADTVVSYALLILIVVLPLVSPERNVLIRQALTPILLVRIFAILVPGLWLLTVIARRKVNLKFSKCAGFVAAFMLAGILANILNWTPHISLYGDSKAVFRGVLFSVCILALFLMVLNIIKRSYLSYLAGAIALSASIVSILGIGQYFGLIPFLFSSQRAYSTLINPLELAGFLVIVLPVLVAIFFRQIETKKNGQLFTVLLAALPIVLAALCLLLTFSRAGIAAALISLALFAIGFSRKSLIKIIPVVAVIALLYAVATIKPMESQPAVGAFAPPSNTIESGNASIESRLATWRIGMKMFIEKPLLGWGDANLANQFRTEEDLLFTREAGSEFTPFDLHNLFINTMVTGGLVGLILFLAVLGYLFWPDWALFYPHRLQTENMEAENYDIYRKGLLFGILGIMLHWQLAPSWIVTETYFWIFIAMIIGTRKRDGRIIDVELGAIGHSMGRVLSIALLAVLVSILAWGMSTAFGALKAEYIGTQAIDLTSKEKYDEAVMEEKIAIADNPSEADYLGRLGFILAVQGRVKKSEGILRKSIAAYKEAIYLQPDDPFRYERLVQVYQALNEESGGKQQDDLLRWTKRAAKINPSSVYLKELIVDLYIERGEEDKAKALRKALEVAK